MPSRRVDASFRDPSGFVFVDNGVVLRQINRSYQEEFSLLEDSGLYRDLVDAKLLIRHEKVDLARRLSDDAAAVIQPEQIGFISYPYEWCFSQLRDAALLTLEVQKTAMGCGMSLKDASAYNVQYLLGRPVFIDTLSFERYREGRPWVAYRQFCQHFLAPLTLMSLVDPGLGKMLRGYVDGIPLDLAGKMLPYRARFKLGIATHILWHGKMQAKAGDPSASSREGKVSRVSLLGIIDSLETVIRSLRYEPTGTVWSDYYANTNYSETAMAEKQRLVGSYLDQISPRPKMVWDLGANTGEFSRIATSKGVPTVAWDLDPAAVERNYLFCRSTPDPNLLPLVQDLTNPSPALGWAHRERQSLTARGPADAVLALALIHHLAIGNNLPFGDIADFFSEIGRWLIIEFVPKEDSQVQRLLSSREDVFPSYDIASFEREFSGRFEIVGKDRIEDSERTLYLMRRLTPA